MEVLSSEVERVRSIPRNIKSVPRFCDLDCIHQTSKFELSELDDNHQNRNKILDSIIENAIREVSIGYTQHLSSELTTRIKQDFESNKSFVVSQRSLGQEKNDGIDYESQLMKFPALKEFVSQTAEKIKQDHRKFIQIAEQYEIDVRRVQISNDIDGEFTASVTELVLEGLRYTSPPLLDKKGTGYYAKTE
jgi:magnesium chelatase subunit I